MTSFPPHIRRTMNPSISSRSAGTSYLPGTLSDMLVTHHSSSAVDGWGFTVGTFAAVLARKLKCSLSSLQHTLWGDYYLTSAWHAREMELLCSSMTLALFEDFMTCTRIGRSLLVRDDCTCRGGRCFSYPARCAGARQSPALRSIRAAEHLGCVSGASMFLSVVMVTDAGGVCQS